MTTTNQPGGAAPSAPFHFRRFVSGTKMAEDVCIEKAGSLDEAIKKAVFFCPQSNAATVLVYLPAAPSVTAEAVEGWTFKEFPNGQFLAQQADGSGAVVTDDSKDGIAQCILARLIKDLLAQRAGTGADAKEAERWKLAREQLRWQLSADRTMSVEEVDAHYDKLIAAMGGETK